MLIKAWCYHESRILGAHHGLISTYALETLVLYIFNMFHKSLHGPLEVNFGSLSFILASYEHIYAICELNILHISALFNRPFIGFWNILASLTGTSMESA